MANFQKCPADKTSRFDSGTVSTMDAAVAWLRAGTPLVFLATGGAATWKYPKASTTHAWPGHYMVLVGVESGPDGPDQIFWVSDPSLAKTKYTSRQELQNCQKWRVFHA